MIGLNSTINATGEGVNSYSINKQNKNQNKCGVQNSPNFKGAVLYTCNNKEEAERLWNHFNYDESTFQDSDKIDESHCIEQDNQVLRLWGDDLINFWNTRSSIKANLDNNHQIPIASKEYSVRGEQNTIKRGKEINRRVFQAFANNAIHVDLRTKRGEKPFVWTGE